MKTIANVISIYEKDHAANVNANAYQTQGLGTLPDAKAAFVEGQFQEELVLTLQYPANGSNAGLLKEERILQSKINDTDIQLMRIYEVRKSLDGNTFTVLAEPLFNDVRKNFIPLLDITEQVGILVAWQRAVALAKPALNTNLYKIVLEGGATTSMATQHMEQANLLQFFAGKEGSLLQMRNPLEFKKDNGTMIISRRLGREHAISAVYTRNLNGLEYTINTQDVVTAYYPFAKYKPEGSEEEILIELPNKVIVQDNAGLYNGTTKTVDFSEDETVKDVATLQTAFDAYVLANEAERTPNISAKVDLITLRNQRGYEKFIGWQTVQLGDGVDVYHPDWDITLSARLMKYHYNILTDRYESLEIGDIKRTFLDDINNNFNNVTNDINNAVNDADLSDVRQAIKDLGEKTEQNTNDLNIVDGALNAVRDNVGNLTTTVGEQGQLINDQGQKINSQGQLIDDYGRAINDQGQLINSQGQLINSYGITINEHGQMINDQGQLIDGHSRAINEQGQLIDSQGNLINSQGQKIDEQGNIIDGQQTQIDDIVDQLSDVVTLPQTEALLEEMGREITGNNGGNVVLDPPTRPERILIMDTASLATAKNVIQMNKSGIAFSTSGQNGPFTSAWTIDGIFNAKWIQTGILSGNNLQINLDTGEVTFVKGTIRNAELTFLIDITTGQIASRGEIPAIGGTGTNITGFDLKNGRLDFISGAFGNATANYGGLRTLPQAGNSSYPSGSKGRGWFAGSAPTITLQMGDPVDAVWQTHKRAVLLASTDYIEPETTELAGTPRSGYGTYTEGGGYENMRGAGMGVNQRYSSNNIFIDEIGGYVSQAWMFGRHGVFLASGYSYDSTIQGTGQYMYPMLRLGMSIVTKGETAESIKQLASTAQLVSGYKIDMRSRIIQFWVGDSGKFEVIAKRTDINSGGGDSSFYGGMSFGQDGAGGRVWSKAVYDRTTSSATNMVVTSNGNIGRSTSARKYKADITEANDVISKANLLYTIKPASWFDKAELKTNGSSDRYYGFIADEFDELGLKEVVQYGDQGQVESLAYDRLSIYMIPLIQEQKKQIDDLKARLEKVEELLN